jgi:hypothetical protein
MELFIHPSKTARRPSATKAADAGSRHVLLQDLARIGALATPAADPVTAAAGNGFTSHRPVVGRSPDAL